MSGSLVHNVSRRHILNGLGMTGLGLACGISPMMPADAAAPEASAWARGTHSRVRLVRVGPATADGLCVAVIEISLDKDFKTYWRTPGDSGIPPQFNFTSSQNARDITVHFPAPTRFEDGAGGHSIGYKGPLVELPVTFRPIQPGHPVKLVLKMDYAVCEKICVPANGTAALVLPPAQAIAPRAVALLTEHLPRNLPLGAAEPLAIARLLKGPKAEHFIVEAMLPGTGESDIFVEAASPWLFDRVAAATLGTGKAGFTVLAIDRDRTPECKGVEVTLTLVSGNRAIETTTWLDVGLLQA